MDILIERYRNTRELLEDKDYGFLKSVIPTGLTDSAENVT